MKESDLALHFIEYFSEGFEIYKEVHNRRGIADFYVVGGGLAMAVEVKTGLSIALIEQGYGNRPYAHYSYIASPTSPGRMVTEICETFGIGILIYKPMRGVLENLKPRLNRKPHLPKFHDYQKDNVAGSICDRTTAFKQFIKSIVRMSYHLDHDHPEGIPLDILYEQLKDPYYASLAICKKNLSVWIKQGVIKEFTLTGGKLFLNHEEIKAKQVEEFKRNLR